MSDWITWFIALFQTCVQWLGSMEILGVSLLWIMIASFFLCLMVRVLLFKP